MQRVTVYLKDKTILLAKEASDKIFIAWYKKKKSSQYPSHLAYYVARKYKNKRQLKIDMMGNYNSCVLILSLQEIMELKEATKRNHGIPIKQLVKTYSTNQKIYDSFYSIVADYENNNLYNYFTSADGKQYYEDENGNIAEANRRRNY